MIRIATLCALLAAALVAPAFAQKDKEKAKGYKTPQEAFDAYATANQKSDGKTLYATLAPQSQKDVAVGFAVGFAASRASTEGSKEKAVQEAAKKFAPVYAVLDKHGLTSKVMKGIPNHMGKKKAWEKTSKAVLEVMKDPEAFFVEMKTAMDKLDFGGPKVKFTEKLADLKIDGDKAKGTMVRTTKIGDEEDVQKQPLEFVKLDDGWRLLFVLNLKDD